jgi:hypothetical protein
VIESPTGWASDIGLYSSACIQLREMIHVLSLRNRGRKAILGLSVAGLALTLIAGPANATSAEPAAVAQPAAAAEPAADIESVTCKRGSEGEKCFNSYCGNENAYWLEYFDQNFERREKLHFERKDGNKKYYSRWMSQSGTGWQSRGTDVHNC